MRDFLDKINKYFKKIKRDGFINASRKAFTRVNSDYMSKLDIKKNINWNKNKEKISNYLDEILEKGNYDRILVWRSSIGWDIPLFQRPQHLTNYLSKNKCLVFYEVTRMTEKVDFIEKKQDNLYLVNYEINGFNKLLKEKLRNVKKNKYLFTASTCWDLSDKLVDNYIKDGYKFLYDYLDHLSPELAGTDKLPRNVSNIHNYVVNNIENCFVICTADILYKDMVNKRKSKENITFACNGVVYEHFTKLNKKVKLTSDFEKILKEKKPIIGYYGAIAQWFDYEMIKYLAKERPEYNIVLIGPKYDASFDKQGLEKYKNIYSLGAKDFNALPYYAKHFNVCTLPFLLNDITASTSPIKVFEYMALAKPIVTTDLIECRKYKSIKIAKDKKQFVNKIDECIKLKDKEYMKYLKQEALANTWESKAKDIIKDLKEFEK